MLGRNKFWIKFFHQFKTWIAEVWSGGTLVGISADVLLDNFSGYKARWKGVEGEMVVRWI